MTTQEAYEQMRIYLTRPGAVQAMDPYMDGCAYETEIDGAPHRCAVGCLLSQTAISYLAEASVLTGLGVEVLIDTFPEAGQELAGVNVEFLNRAQVLHDAASAWETGIFDVARLDDIALRFGLDLVEDEPVGAPRELAYA